MSRYICPVKAAFRQQAKIRLQFVRSFTGEFQSRLLMTAMGSDQLKRTESYVINHTRRIPPDERQQPARRQPCHERLPRGGRQNPGIEVPMKRLEVREVLEPRPISPPPQSSNELAMAAEPPKQPPPPAPPKDSKLPAVRSGGGGAGAASGSAGKGSGGSGSGGQGSAGSGAGGKGGHGNVKPIAVTLMPGDGIGPEISLAVLQILKAVNAPLLFEPVDVTPVINEKGIQTVPQAVIDSMQRTKLGLKGPLMTPVGTGFRSLNLILRVLFNLYANVRPCRSLAGVETVYGKVDVITIRENTEGEYSGIEHQLVNGVVQSIKLITRPATLRVAEYCFQYAIAMKRKKITAVHKRSSMRMSDGLFINSVREVAEKYKDQLKSSGIIYEEQAINEVCLKIVANPTQYDVLVMPNLYGDILSDTCAGLIGGLGLTPSGNIGTDGAIFEAVHGTAPNIAGQDMANPTALLLSAAMLLRYINMGNYADKIEAAVVKTIKVDNVRTMDLGGKAKCSEYTQAVIKNLG
ncbi:hypothetical protein ACLKA7_015899 [Drosophila subpalustris]